MAKKFFDRDWWKDFVVAIIATTVSIVLTFGTASLVNRINQKKERRLTALMVMSNIESFARDLEETEKELATIDSVASWLLKLPIDDVVKLGHAPFDEPMAVVFGVPILHHDRTAETIFSSNIDTWKNMGNYQLIDNVGQCFSQMNWWEDYYNEYILQIKSTKDRIYNNPKEFPGSTLIEKYLRDEPLRRQLLKPHSIRVWLRYNTAQLRGLNRLNMQLAGITEEEVMRFTDTRSDVAVDENEELHQIDFRIPSLPKDSLVKHLTYAREVDSLLCSE